MLTDGRIFVHLLRGGWLLSEKSSPKSLAVEVSLALSFPTPTADGPSQLCFLTAPSSQSDSIGIPLAAILDGFLMLSQVAVL